MTRAATIVSLAFEAGGLLLFWVLGVVGLEPYATGAVILFVAGDAWRRRRNRLGFPRVWRLFNGLALGLALLDLAMRGSAFARYEGIAVNILIAMVFMLGALSRKPIVQEIAEQRMGMPFPEDRHDLRAFFRAYTWVWAAYFLCRAGVWLWLAETMPVARAQDLEGLIGPFSLFAMILVSFWGSALFRGAKRVGLFRSGG